MSSQSTVNGAPQARGWGDQLGGVSARAQCQDPVTGPQGPPGEGLTWAKGRASGGELVPREWRDARACPLANAAGAAACIMAGLSVPRAIAAQRENVVVRPRRAPLGGVRRQPSPKAWSSCRALNSHIMLAWCCPACLLGRVCLALHRAIGSLGTVSPNGPRSQEGGQEPKRLSAARNVGLSAREARHPVTASGLLDQGRHRLSPGSRPPDDENHAYASRDSGASARRKLAARGHRPL